MPYRRSNYDFVIDSSFQPFSMQEMLVPFTAYKEAYDKDEAAYQDLTDRADTFKYLAKRLEDNQDSESARIYKGYADELNRQAQDLANNGLTMSGRRGLTNLKRRYQGEIGRLITADAAMKEEQKLRRANKDNSMLYAQDNLDIDDFLDGKTPNLYSISGNELYTRGAQAGKTASSRVYSAGDEGSTLGGYYRKWVERNGYSKESMDAFRANASAIPELQQAADAILAERGVNENLRGNNLERARQSVINGIIDGSVYQEKVNPVRDPGVMSAQEQDASRRAWAGYELSKQELAMKKQDWMDNRALKYNFLKDDKGNPVLDENGLPKVDTSNPINPAYMAAAKKGKNPDGSSKEGNSNAVSKTDALLKLGHKELANDAGFEVTADGTRHHYDYIGGLSKHGGKWRQGGMGEDAPGTGWGLFSTSNVEGWWGNYTAESVDDGNAITNWIWPQKVKERMRVLSDNEIASKFGKDEGLQEAFTERVNTYLKEHNIDPKSQAAQSLDIQIIEVPNEIGGRGESGYLIAIN